MLPPPDLRRASNRAGTVIVYFASFWFRPLHDQDELVLPWDRMVTVLPSCVSLTGLSRRKASSSAVFLRPIFRQTSTTTSLVALVPTLTEPKSTSTTTVPPGWTGNCWWSFSSVAARAAREVSRRKAKVGLSIICFIVMFSVTLSWPYGHEQRGRSAHRSYLFLSGFGQRLQLNLNSAVG